MDSVTVCDSANDDNSHLRITTHDLDGDRPAPGDGEDYEKKILCAPSLAIMSAFILLLVFVCALQC